MAVKFFKETRNWDISWMCKKLNISRYGHYKWLDRKETEEKFENKQLATWITEYDIKFKHISGYRRMRNWIN